MRVVKALTDDLRLKLGEQSGKSRRLGEDLDGSRRELRSCQNGLLIAREQIGNLGGVQQYQEEQHRASLADLENKIDVACMEDDTGKVQLSVELHESVRTVGELQGELTNEVRQLDLIQTEVKRNTDSRDAVVAEKEKLEHQAVQYQNELRRVSDVNTITEKNNVRLTKDNMALGYNASSKEKELFALKKVVSQLEKSGRERSQKADVSPSPDTESLVAKMNSKLPGRKPRTRHNKTYSVERSTRWLELMTRHS